MAPDAVVAPAPDGAIDLPASPPVHAPALPEDSALPDARDAAPGTDVGPGAVDVLEAGADTGGEREGGRSDAGQAMLAASYKSVRLFANPGCTSVEAVRFTNTGESPTAPLMVMIGAPFVIGNDGCTGHVLGPDETCEIQVKFTPASDRSAHESLRVVAGPVSRVLDVLGDTPNPPWQSFWVEGLRFGALRVGATKRLKRTVYLWGGATEPISVSDVSVSGSEFRLTKDACKGVTLGPGQACAVEVTFTPAATGERRANLTVSAPGACGGDQVVASLEGIGAMLPAGPLVIDPGAIEFDGSPVDCGRSTSAHVSNTGQATTVPLSVAVTGGFRLGHDGCSGMTLAAGAGCDVEVRPTYEPGRGEGTLTVTAAGTMDQIPLSVILNVSGAGLQASPHQVDFGTVPFGATSERKRVTLAPDIFTSGTDISGVTFSVIGDDFRIAEDQCKGVITKSGCAVDLVFEPRRHQFRGGFLNITGPFQSCTPEEMHIQLSGYSPE